MREHHPWTLVAPWYRWKQQGAPPRETRPVFQKYENPDLVNAFLKDPQLSLRFLPEDEVQKLYLAEKISSGPYKNRPKIFAEQEARANGIRKIFLSNHRRFYLVVCELHCDAPGFPSVERGQVCEAGFVVRRRRTVVSAPEKQKAAEK